MARIIVLDSKPSGIACDSPRKPHVAALLEWIRQANGRGRTQVILPEIADYEVRRKLISLEHGSGSVRRLDALVSPGNLLIYLPINTAAMRRAARMWADARSVGLPTAPPDALDGDVILAAQALEYAGAGDRLFIATHNESDLSRYVGDRARPWEAITP